jgi:hypothetical protein
VEVLRRRFLPLRSPRTPVPYLHVRQSVCRRVLCRVVCRVCCPLY